MKKRISILFLLLLTITAVSFADIQKDVKLDNVKKTGERIVFDHFDICLKLTEDANDYIKVDVDIENTDEEKGILLFDRAYSEDELKKRQPKIKFHKDFSGSKGKRITDAYSPHIRNNIVYIEPGEKTDLLTMIFENNGGDGTLNLPVYMINYKEDRNSVPFEKNELVILQEEKVELVVEVEVKQEPEPEPEPEKVDPNIVSEYNKLKAEYDTVVFCTNENHEPSCEEQMEMFQERIDSLKDKIDNKIKTDNLFTTDSLYFEYDTLKKKLDSLDLSKKESVCGKHGKRNGHSCWLCNGGYSLKWMFNRLNKIYQKIYSSHGQDREAIKKYYYYNVCDIYMCAQHREEWQHSKYKDKIEKYYNKTMEFYQK